VQREQTGPLATIPAVKNRFLEAFCEVFAQPQPPLQQAEACAALLAVHAQADSNSIRPR
jgi:hypothetical protein